MIFFLIPKSERSFCETWVDMSFVRKWVRATTTSEGKVRPPFNLLNVISRPSGKFLFDSSIWSAAKNELNVFNEMLIPHVKWGFLGIYNVWGKIVSSTKILSSPAFLLPTAIPPVLVCSVGQTVVLWTWTPGLLTFLTLKFPPDCVIEPTAKFPSIKSIKNCQTVAANRKFIEKTKVE